MRARSGPVLGRLAIVAWVGLLAVTAMAEIRAPDRDRSGADPGPEAADALVDAWARSRRATFVTTGTYERRSDVTGAAVASEDVVAQRPPRRLHRQLGGVNGRDDDRLLVCPAPPPGENPAPCRLGPAGGPTYEESVEREVEGLRSILLGPDPLYAVARGEPGCFRLDLRRPDPRAPFGIEASFCFDPATGAPTGSRVRHEGGVEEVVVVTDVRTEVTDADLEP
ncbi:MAG: hypothetical protein ACLGI8_12430 [Acidimicrobiia bacterium]